MKVISNLSLTETATAATVGFFDGVHIGHRYLISRLKDYAQKTNLKTAVVTFPVHPRKILQKNYQPFLLNTFEEKIQQLASTGIDYCYIIDFNRKFSNTTAQEFIQQILHRQLRVKELLIGYDHRFGRGRTSEYKQYVEYGKDCGINVHQAEKLPEKDIHNSSTSIRQLLLEGNTEKAADLLSYYYSLEGKIVQGNRLGRTIGFPTANIAPNSKEKIIPREGVYATYVFLNEQKYSGMTYIGKRPTVTSEGEKRIEVNILDFEKDIYGEKIRIEFTAFIRPDIHFNGLQELQKQLQEDRLTIRKTLLL